VDAARCRALTPPAALDGAVVAVLLAVGLAGFWPVFGGPAFLRPAGAGLLLGAGLAWLGAWRRWNTATVAVTVLAGYFIFGTAAAWPDQALAGLIPNLASLRGLVFGAVEVWRQFLTATTPVDSFVGLTLVPFIVASLGAVLAFSAAWRSARPALTLIPVGVVLLAVIALGTARPFWPTVQALLLIGAALPWLAWRRRQSHSGLGQAKESSTVRWARWRDCALILTAAGLATVCGGGALAAGLDRDVARAHVVPPLDLRAYASPLAGFRHLIDRQGDETLFTVEGWNQDYRLRLAVLDSYDGLVYAVGGDSPTGRYDRVGPDLGDDSDPTGAAVTITVTVGAYSGVWVPGLSSLDQVRFSGPRATQLTQALYYNATADAVVDPVGLTEGDAYSVTAHVSQIGSQHAVGHGFAAVALPTPRQVPEVVADQAGKLAGEAREPVERVQNIIAGLSQQGFFSHGLADQEPSKPGHSAARLSELLAKSDRMVGDDEQYAVAAALMLRQLGVPARVVMGFRADDESSLIGDTWLVRGGDVHAWVEVAFDGLGWIPFDPTPDEDQKPTEQTPLSRSDPKPQILQPPPPPVEPEAEAPDNPPEERQSDDEEDESFDWAQVARLAGLIALPVLFLLGPPAAVLWLKRRRTNRRRQAHDLSDRLAGGWLELLDRAADLGAVAPAAATRAEAAGLIRRHLAEPVDRVTDLAQRADRAVFAAASPTADEVAAYWADVASVRQGWGAAVPVLRRCRAAVALTSLRPHPGATVDGGTGP
jgi:hypothetical protein